MKSLVILLLLLLVSGCATTGGHDSASMPPEVVEAQPADKLQPVEKVSPESKPEVTAIAPVETPDSTLPAGVKQKAESHPSVEKELHHGRKVVSTPGAKTKGQQAEKLSPMARVAAANDEKLLRVYVGMDKSLVELIMKSAHNPAKREQITGKDGQLYEVLFYLNREPREGKPVTERHMTPVIFKDKKVVAIGKFHLKKLRSSGNIERKRGRASRS
jgi:hypothetical protein